jgi:hypothetical protein
MLRKIQRALCAFSASPKTFVGACFFLSGWLGGYFLSGGKFDPGLGVGNLIINGLGLLLMFAACSLAANANQKSDDVKAAHDELHAKVDALSDKMDGQDGC